MKMSPDTFEALRRDFYAVVNRVQDDTGFPVNYTRLAVAWHIFHAVQHDRHETDNHPTFQQRSRYLAYVGPRCDHEAFYRAGLNDAHIETALRKIMKS